MSDPTRVDAARRRLLRAGLYVAPVVASLVTVSEAKAQAISCTPATCTPPCAPDNPQGCGPDDCNPRCVPRQ